MNNNQQQIVEKLKGANNILVTVSSNPTVDQLAACIGLTLLLNKLKKHATAVFSGDIPSIIEFLQPEATLEKNTDSLRDFIIALDKSKADKLRYKVEDRVVKIFITPYRTSIGEADLEFSQGDFNVDVVVALGVHEQQDLDQAITAHGRILHDATVMSINLTPNGDLGTINWVDPAASSLSELVASIAGSLGKDLFDSQIATALLTGIVAETERFSNEKTSPNTMSISSQLLSAGANQQLVASKLQGEMSVQNSPGNNPQLSEDGNLPPEAPDGETLDIGHAKADQPPEADQPPAEQGLPEVPPELPKPEEPPEQVSDGSNNFTGTPKIITQPPVLGGQLTANTRPEEELEPAIDSLGLPHVDSPILNHNPAPTSPSQPTPPSPVPSPPSTPQDTQIHIDEDGNLHPSPPKPADTPQTAMPPEDDNDQTLVQIEEAVNSPHVEEEQQETKESAPDDLTSARDAVAAAINGGPNAQALEPIEALNAQPLGQDLHDDTQPPAGPGPSSVPPIGSEPAPIASSPSDQPMDMPLPPNLASSAPGTTPPTSYTSDSTAPPPVPPPIPPNYLNPNP